MKKEDKAADGDGTRKKSEVEGAEFFDQLSSTQPALSASAAKPVVAEVPAAPPAADLKDPLKEFNQYSDNFLSLLQSPAQPAKKPEEKPVSPPAPEPKKPPVPAPVIAATEEPKKKPETEPAQAQSPQHAEEPGRIQLARPIARKGAPVAPTKVEESIPAKRDEAKAAAVPATTTMMISEEVLQRRGNSSVSNKGDIVILAGNVRKRVHTTWVESGRKTGKDQADYWEQRGAQRLPRHSQGYR